MYLGDLFGSSEKGSLRVHGVPYGDQVSVAQPATTGKLVQRNPRMGQVSGEAHYNGRMASEKKNHLEIRGFQATQKRKCFPLKNWNCDARHKKLEMRDHDFQKECNTHLPQGS